MTWTPIIPHRLTALQRRGLDKAADGGEGEGQDARPAGGRNAGAIILNIRLSLRPAPVGRFLQDIDGARRFGRRNPFQATMMNLERCVESLAFCHVQDDLLWASARIVAQQDIDEFVVEAGPSLARQLVALQDLMAAFDAQFPDQTDPVLIRSTMRRHLRRIEFDLKREGDHHRQFRDAAALTEALATAPGVHDDHPEAAAVASDAVGVLEEHHGVTVAPDTVDVYAEHYEATVAQDAVDVHAEHPEATVAPDTMDVHAEHQHAIAAPEGPAAEAYAEPAPQGGRTGA